MASLPLELIEHICSLLCTHCQNPGSFPDADSNDVRSAQKTLAHLCRLSRRVCAVAQPFLFHQYSTGNLPPQHDCSARGHVRTFAREADNLPAFLRAMIDRPDLATHIRTLQLVETDEIGGLTPDLAPFLVAASQRIGASHHTPTSQDLQTKVWRLSNQPEKLRRIQRRKIHHWLEELAILLAPNVEMLLVARDSFCQYQHVRDSGLSLPTLKLICLRGVSRNQHVHEASGLLNAAPNLRALHSTQCSLFDGLSPWTLSKPWMLSLDSLQRLVVSEIGFEDLALLVACCPKLRELEVTAINIHRTAGHDYWDVSKLLQTLGPVRHQLRKLRLTHSPSHRSGADQRLVASDASSWSFRDFVRLEELAFDQGEIECRPRLAQTEDGTSAPSSLVEILPPSLKSLHVTYVDSSLMRELELLAGESAYRLPYLKLVKTSLVLGIEKRDAGLKCMDAVTSSFSTAGVEVQWDTMSVVVPQSTG